jgi:hypothetical protein
MGYEASYIVPGVLQRQFSYSQPRWREENRLCQEECLSELTSRVRRRAANIGLGMTPLPPNSGRIPSLT